MNSFEKVRFNGTFRNYQQKVLDSLYNHIEDGKVHIVAAPGSGKTILGLELIRYLNEPALILSPSITIRQQWGERFKENFLLDKSLFDELFSYSFQSLKLINSVTYQSLYAALNKIKDKEHKDDEEEEEIDQFDYSSYELFEEIKKHNIITICLDEAHHLRSEWQKALEEFILLLGDEIKIVSLTATPPYDSTPGEWKKYSSLCGEIDEEIFIPELVGQKNLCPHQDFIYFSYPSEKESKQLKAHRSKILECIDYICSQSYFENIIKSIHIWYKKDEYSILENYHEISCILALGNFFGYVVENELIKLVCPTDVLPNISFSVAQEAFQFICDKLSFFFETSKIVFDEIKSRGLIERKKVNFIISDKLSNSLSSSTGKFQAIGDIVKHEYLSLNDGLRMVILTDYIKKDLLNVIGTNEPLKSLGTASIFEYIRRLNVTSSLCILSGSLIIVENKIVEEIVKEARNFSLDLSTKKIKNTDEYVEIVFSGKNKEKVNVITKIFEKGFIKIIIGTKSLLGEGWDSPCINSLILASFVKSFMLSNQMRGRAIRIDKNNENKCSNIWHLATIEDEYCFIDEKIERLNKTIFNVEEEIVSPDFDLIKKRFDCFLAPSYSKDVIEDGIQRIDTISKPFTKEHILKINEATLKVAKDKEAIISKWRTCTKDIENMKIVEECDIPYSSKPTILIMLNIISIFVGLLTTSCLSALCIYNRWINVKTILIVFIIFNIFSFAQIINAVIKLFRFITSYKTTKTLGKILLKSLKKTNIIKSKEAKLLIKEDKENNIITCGIVNGTIYEKDVFTKAFLELLSQIENPRYLLVKKFGKLYNFSSSYSCPSILANNREKAKVLAKNLELVGGRYELIYTRLPGGRMNILKARKFSYINKNGNNIKRIKRVISVDDRINA